MEVSSRKTFYSSSCKIEEDSSLYRQAQNGRFRLSCRKCSRAPSEGPLLARRGQCCFLCSIVSFKEIASLGSLIQPALQFSYVETRFLMLAEGRTLEYSFVFFWNHYAAKLDVRVLVFFGWALIM
jgi:hypothetical protein